MTEKEFKRLSREDLLKLLIEQGREMIAQEERFKHNAGSNEEAAALRKELASKEEQIHSLIRLVEEKDHTIYQLRDELKAVEQMIREKL